MTQELTITEVEAYSILGRVLYCTDKGQPIPALTPDEIDACLLEFEQREIAADAAMERVKQAKAGVIAYIQQHGSPVPHAEQSKRVTGWRNVATVTTPCTTVVHESAVDELGTYCAGENLDAVFERMFSVERKWKMIDGARNVLAGVSIAKRTHERILSLFGRCIDIKPKAPSLTVQTVKPEKPARKPRGKAAA